MIVVVVNLRVRICDLLDAIQGVVRKRGLPAQLIYFCSDIALEVVREAADFAERITHRLWTKQLVVRPGCNMPALIRDLRQVSTVVIGEAHFFTQGIGSARTLSA